MFIVIHSFTVIIQTPDAVCVAVVEDVSSTAAAWVLIDTLTDAGLLADDAAFKISTFKNR